MQNRLVGEDTPKNRHVILVVDDEPLVRAATSEGLRHEGFDVLEACDADEAVLILSAIQVDAVFSDITMPGSLDGIGLAEWARQHRPSLKVVLTSATLHLPPELGTLGPLVHKPYRLDDVVTRLRRELRTLTP